MLCAVANYQFCLFKDEKHRASGYFVYGSSSRTGGEIFTHPALPSPLHLLVPGVNSLPASLLQGTGWSLLKGREDF